MITFLEFLDFHEHATGKTALYPWGYQGVGAYPPAYVINQSADAFVYMDVDDRFRSVLEGKPFDITHLPSQAAVKEPKNTFLPGKITSPKGHNMPGKETPPTPHGMPGKEVSPGGPRMKCLVRDPKTLGPEKTVQNGAEDSVCKNMFKMPD